MANCELLPVHRIALKNYRNIEDESWDLLMRTREIGEIIWLPLVLCRN